MANQFDKKIILEAIAEYVAKYADENITLLDIHDSASFSLKPWIKGKYRASEALKDFNEQDQLYEKTNLDGVFGAIEYVQDYETHQYGEVLANLLDPEAVAYMVAFINGEKTIYELSEALDIDLYEELTEKQAEQLLSVETMEELLKK